MPDLDYRHTCSEIDQAIEDHQELVTELVYDFLQDIHLYELMTDEDSVKARIASFVKDHIDTSAFETVRSTNEDMRKAADDQLNELDSDLTKEIEDLKDELASAYSQIEQLESQVEN